MFSIFLFLNFLFLSQVAIGKLIFFCPSPGRNLAQAAPFHTTDILKTCLVDSRRHILKTCLVDVQKTYLEDVLKTLWRQAKYLLGIPVSNKSKCVSNKSIFHKSISDNSKANPKCINQNPIISLFLILKLKQHLYFKN